MASTTNHGNGNGLVDSHGHFHGNTNRYWLVWLALLGLTAVTYYTAKQHWPTIALPLALFIACVKAGLVVAIFMHLKDTKGPPLISFSVSVFMVIMLILGVLGDLAFRYPMARPDGIRKIEQPPLGYRQLNPSPARPIGNPRGMEVPTGNAK